MAKVINTDTNLQAVKVAADKGDMDKVRRMYLNTSSSNLKAAISLQVGAHLTDAWDNLKKQKPIEIPDNIPEYKKEYLQVQRRLLERKEELVEMLTSPSVIKDHTVKAGVGASRAVYGGSVMTASDLEWESK